MKDQKKAKDSAAKTLRLLVVEDSPDDAALVTREIQRGGFEVTWKRVDTEAAMKAALDAELWDAVVSDYIMPNFDGLSALRVLQDSGLDIPFIVVSGSIGEEIAVEAMKAGAHDYLIKDKLARLAPAIERELRDAASRRERHQSEAALRESEKRFRTLFENAAVGIAELTPEGRWMQVNSKLCEMVGYTEDELLKLTFQDITHPDDLEKDLEFVQEMLKGKRTTYTMDKRYIRKDRSIVWIKLTVSMLRHADGTPDRFISIITDINNRKQAERELSDRNKELKRFNTAAIGRELRMVELKNEVNELCRKLGTIEAYPLHNE